MEDVHKFGVSIKKKYQERRIDREKQWPPRHSDKLVRLELVEREKGEGYSANTQRDRKSKGTKRTPLRYSDLFKVEGGKRPVRKVLVEGDAGIGKTTFCIAVSEDWANGKLFQQFELVLLLQLRMKAVASAGSLPELLKLLHSNPRLCKSVARYLEEEEGESVLIIADGWDELSESERQEGSFLYQLLFQLYPFMSVVVTSRPSASAPLRELPEIDQFVEVHGFSKEDIVEYIQSEFTSDQEKADRLLEHLEYNPLIENVCSVPLNCAIVCHLWRTLEEALPTTMTELYTKIILSLVLRNIHKLDAYKSILSLPKFDSLPADLQPSWWLLCEFAFQALEKDQLVFSQEELKVFFPGGLALDKRILCFGLLQHAASIGLGISFHFLHWTFQEYFAALHLARQTPDKQLKVFFKSHKPNSRFAMVLRFFFGINNFNTDSSSAIPQMLDFVKGDIPTLFLDTSICHCAFEGHSNLINNKVIEYIISCSCRDLDMIDFGNPHTAHDCTAILHVLANIPEYDDCIRIGFDNSCGIKENQIKKFIDILVSKEGKLNITELSLSGNKLTVSSLQALENAVRDDLLHSLQYLNLEGCLSSDADTNVAWLTTFVEALSAHCPYMNYLNFSDNNLHVPGASTLLKIWDCHSACSLVLRNTELGDEGLDILSKSLKKDVHLQDLGLESNDIHATSVSRLVDTICSQKAVIINDLNLGDNPLGLEGTIAVGRMLSSGHCKPHNVHLFNCELTTAGGSLLNTDSLNLGKTVSCEAIGQQLCQMPQNSNIRYLDLSGNGFTGEGIHILVGFVHLCPHLGAVFARDCGITSDDLIWFLDKLTQLKSSSPSLCSRVDGWFLEKNQIDDRGVSTLLNHLPSLFPCSAPGSFKLDNNQVSYEMMKRLNEECRSRIQRRDELPSESSSDKESSSEGSISVSSGESSSDESFSDKLTCEDDCNEQTLPVPPSTVSDQLIRPLESAARNYVESVAETSSLLPSPPLLSLSTLPTTQYVYQPDVPEPLQGEGSSSDTESDASLDLQPPPSKRHKGGTIIIPDLAHVEHRFLALVQWEDENGIKRELRIYSKIAHKWRQIATQLGFEPGEIESIDADYRTSYCRITIVLGRWFENARNLPNARRYPKSWQGLINLLKDVELGEVAEELEKALSSTKNSVRENLS